MGESAGVVNTAYPGVACQSRNDLFYSPAEKSVEQIGFITALDLCCNNYYHDISLERAFCTTPGSKPVMVLIMCKPLGPPELA